MTFPSINYKFNDLNEAQELTEVVDQKLAAFDKYIGGAKALSCDVEFAKVTQQQKGDIFRIEVNLMVDGALYRAEATKESFEKAIDEVRDELDKELRRAKEKQETLEKQGGREIKEKMMAGTE
jgi:ribosomal subunit interface protein